MNAHHLWTITITSFVIFLICVAVAYAAVTPIISLQSIPTITPTPVYEPVAQRHFLVGPCRAILYDDAGRPWCWPADEEYDK